METSPFLHCGREKKEVKWSGASWTVGQGLTGWSQSQGEAGSALRGQQWKGLSCARVEGASDTLHRLEKAFLWLPWSRPKQPLNLDPVRLAPEAPEISCLGLVSIQPSVCLTGQTSPSTMHWHQQEPQALAPRLQHLLGSAWLLLPLLPMPEHPLSCDACPCPPASPCLASDHSQLSKALSPSPPAGRSSTIHPSPHYTWTGGQSADERPITTNGETEAQREP